MFPYTPNYKPVKSISLRVNPSPHLGVGKTRLIRPTQSVPPRSMQFLCLFSRVQFEIPQTCSVRISGSLNISMRVPDPPRFYLPYDLTSRNPRSSSLIFEQPHAQTLTLISFSSSCTHKPSLSISLSLSLSVTDSRRLSLTLNHRHLSHLTLNHGGSHLTLSLSLSLSRAWTMEKNPCPAQTQRERGREREREGEMRASVIESEMREVTMIESEREPP
jgi:hypothetical protein